MTFFTGHNRLGKDVQRRARNVPLQQLIEIARPNPEGGSFGYRAEQRRADDYGQSRACARERGRDDDGAALWRRRSLGRFSYGHRDPSFERGEPRPARPISLDRGSPSGG